MYDKMRAQIIHPFTKRINNLCFTYMHTIIHTHIMRKLKFCNIFKLISYNVGTCDGTFIIYISKIT